MICPLDHQPCTMDHSEACRQICLHQKEQEGTSDLPSRSSNDMMDSDERGST